MKKRVSPLYYRSFLIILLFIVFSIFLFLIPYRMLRSMTIRSINEQNMLLAKQTALSLSEFFNFYHTLLQRLVTDPDVAKINKEGKEKINDFYTFYSNNLQAITRINPQGIIVYTYPYSQSIIGIDVSQRQHHQIMLRTMEPVVSDVFMAYRGYNTVTYTIPVFDERKEYQGWINALIPFDIIAERYLNNLKIEKNSQFWLISGSGSVIHSSHKEHIGESIFTAHSNEQSLLKMAILMTNGQTDCCLVYGEKKEPMHAVLFPIKLPHNQWSLAISIPEKEILKDVRRFGVWWVILFLVFDSLLFFIVIRWVRKYTIAIEEKKRLETEHRLRETEVLLSQFIHNAPIPILMARMDGTIEFINRQFQENFGYHLEDLSTFQNFFRDAFPDDCREEDIVHFWEKELKNILGTLLSHKLKEKKMRSLQGEQREVVLTFTAIEDRIVVSFDDRTVQNELNRREQDFLSRQNRSRKMEAIGLMAGGVAHDLNNILSGIVSYPDLLLMKLPPDSDLRKPMEVIRESGMRAASVVSDLLTVARGVTSAREFLDVHEVIGEYLDSPEFKILKSDHPEVKIETDMDKEDQKIQIFASKVHVRKSLMNLVNNAVEAIPTTGKVMIRTGIQLLSKEEADLYKIPSGRYCYLEVQDTGTGISPEDREHIFEPFYTKKKMGKSGTGLGLSIVWNTAQDNGGTVIMSSDESGTVFRMYLPEIKGETTGRNQDAELEDLKGNKELILVVDDEEMQASVAEKILLEFNYKVVRAFSGEEALEKFRQSKVDLVLLDMIMGNGMNGKETYQEMVKIQPRQKAIIVSGYSHNSEVDDAIRMGVNSYLSKPYTIEQLIKTVRKVLDQKH